MPDKADKTTATDDAKPTADKAGADEPVDAGASSGNGKGEEPKYTQRDLDSIVDKVAARVRREAEDNEKKLKAEAEKERLKQEGKFQEMYEKERQEREALEAEKRHNAFMAEARDALKKREAVAFEDILLKPMDTIEQIEERADALRAVLDKEIERQVNDRLGTGKRPADTTPSSPKPWSELAPEQWKEKKAELGIF